MLQAENIKKELSALRAVLKCISDFNLKSHFSSKSILLRIKQLEKAKKGKKHSLKSLKKITESDIKQSARPTSCANSEDTMAEGDNCGQAVFNPVTPINPEAKLQAGVKRSVSVTASLRPPEWAGKRPRVELARVPTSSAPWPQPGPCSGGQAIHVMPDVACTRLRGPFPASNGPKPNFGVGSAVLGVAPHLCTGPSVVAADSINALVPAYDGKASFSSY